MFENKKVYICFLIAIAIMAASPVRAAGLDASLAPAPARELVVRVDPRTGKLIRTVAPPPKSAAARPAPPAKHQAEISAIVKETAETHQVDPLLVDSIIQVESNYNPYAISAKGAEGLMQLMPPTARMLGVSNSFDPRQNIEAGVRYLKQLQDQYKDDRLALAAYNAGPAAVEKYRWIPPYRETQDYVNQVGKRYGDARKAADDAAAAAQPAATPGNQPAETAPAASQNLKEEKHPKLEQFVDEYGRLHLRAIAP